MVKKKKIKDFTIDEINKICLNTWTCARCPLGRTAYSGCPIQRMSGDDLEREFEVEE